MSATRSRWPVWVLAAAAFGCIAGAVTASAFRDRWAMALAAAALTLIVAALAVLRRKGGRQ